MPCCIRFSSIRHHHTSRNSRRLFARRNTPQNRGSLQMIPPSWLAMAEKRVKSTGVAPYTPKLRKMEQLSSCPRGARVSVRLVSRVSRRRQGLQETRVAVGTQSTRDLIVPRMTERVIRRALPPRCGHAPLPGHGRLPARQHR